MMKKIIYKSLCGLFLLVSAYSCSLDEYNPTVISADETLSKFDNWKAWQSNCYSGLHGSLVGLQYNMMAETGTDIWALAAGGTSLQETMIYNGLTSNYGYVKDEFKLAYSSIQICNKTIDLASKLTDGNAADVNVLIAEARMLRGYYYSVLAEQFGEITLMLDANASFDLKPKRNTYAEIYGQIVADLKFAAENLGTTPYDNNPQRVTKKAALGLLARVYAQGAGEGLTENGTSYWQRAKEVALDVINNKYGATLYSDFSDVFASANNRVNTEALFSAYGPNPYDASYNVYTGAAKPNMNIYYFPQINTAVGTDMSIKTAASNTSNCLYGRLNQGFMAPSKYLIDCYDAKYDKRWENTFVTAFANYSAVQTINNLGDAAPSTTKNWTYAKGKVSVTAALCAKYGIPAANAGKTIYPYCDVDTKLAPTNATYQYPSKVWPKGEHSGDVSKLVSVKNIFVNPYPLDEDEDRFFLYLSKDYLSATDKANRGYLCINIDDLFDSNGSYKAVYSENSGTATTLNNLFPAMLKFNHNFDGGWLGGDFQRKLGNVMIVRMAEMYLIAAEATLMTNGSASEAAGYLNVLRQRATRVAADYDAHMKLTTADMNTVYDEYARELCGEFVRWGLLKRHRATQQRLALYNKPAATYFDANKHYLRPISYDFLSQIDNAEEYGSNGY